MIILAGVLNYVDRQIIAVLKPMIEQNMGWSDRDYARLASIFQFSAALAFIATGSIVDRLGVRWAAPAGVAAWSAAAMAHGWALTTGQFFVARAALGATESMGTPTSVKTIGGLFSSRSRSTAFGVANGAANAGAIVTPLILPALALAVGWRGTFVVAGALGFVWTAVWIFLTREIAAPAPRVSEPGILRRSARSIGQLLSDRRSWGIAGAKALSDQVWWLLLFWAPDFFHRAFGLGMGEIGVPLAVVYGASAAGSIASGWIAARLIDRGMSIDRARKGMMLVCAVLAMPVVLAASARRLWVAAGLLGLTLAAHQGFSVSVYSTIADIIPKERVGAVTSFGALCGNLAGMGIVFLAGEVLARGLGYGPLLIVAAASYISAWLWLQLWVPRLRFAD